MKRGLILMVCLMVLPWVAIAVEYYAGEKVPCRECMASLITQVGPGDSVSLDGTVADVDIPNYLTRSNVTIQPPFQITRFKREKWMAIYS